MRYPAFLKENGIIGFVAPSFGCNIEPYRSAFENARNRWEKEGFGMDLGPNCFEGRGIGISNTPELCGRELTEYYIKKENDCLISCGGGELMCEILEHVDFEAINKAAPKWYMGYSDNTNMTFLLTTLCDTASIYGPCAAAFGMEPLHPALQDAMGILTGRKQEVSSYGKWEKEGLKDEEHPLLPYHCTEDLQLKIFLPEDVKEVSDLSGGGVVPERQAAMKLAPEAEMSGRLIGGCMDCLVNLLGTRFDRVKEFNEKYQEDGFIWFLESCDLNVFAIRRAMWQMEQAGWFQHVKGFLIGRPLCHGQEMMGMDQYSAVLKVASRHQVPVIMDADLGHLPPMMPLVTGSLAKLQAKENGLRINMQFE